MAGDPKRARFAGAVIIYVVLCLGSTSAAPCHTYTWFSVPSATVANGTQVISSDLPGCQSVCLFTADCVGVSWNNITASGSRCILNTAAAAATNTSGGIVYYNVSEEFTYYGILRNVHNCDYSDYNCSFQWVVQKDVHSFYAIEDNSTVLSDCVRTCQETAWCKALDWNYQESSCWLYHNTEIPTREQKYIYYFVKTCVDHMPTTGTQPAPLPIGLDMTEYNEDSYPMAIKPAYIVLAGVGGGCILQVILAVGLLCCYPLRGTEAYSKTSTLRSTHVHHTTITTSTEDSSSSRYDSKYVESNDPESVDMREVSEVEAEGKEYYNANEVNGGYDED